MFSHKEIRLTGSVNFSVPLTAVWALLTTPEQVGQCVPGLLKWEEVIPNFQFKLTLAWDGQNRSNIVIPASIQWHIIEPPYHSGQGAVLGLSFQATPLSMTQISFKSDIKLVQLDEKLTRLDFTAVGNTPNPFLDQILKNVLPKQIDIFFSCMMNKLQIHS